MIYKYKYFDNCYIRYRDNFGQDYFSFWCGGVLFLVINTQYYKNCANVKKHAGEQDQWLMEKLNNHKKQRIIVFQHIPWFVKNIDERTQYFNVERKIRQSMLEKLHAAGKFVMIEHITLYITINIYKFI